MQRANSQTRPPNGPPTTPECPRITPTAAHPFQHLGGDARVAGVVVHDGVVRHHQLIQQDLQGRGTVGVPSRCGARGRATPPGTNVVRVPSQPFIHPAATLQHPQRRRPVDATAASPLTLPCRSTSVARVSSNPSPVTHISQSTATRSWVGVPAVGRAGVNTDKYNRTGGLHDERRCFSGVATGRRRLTGLGRCIPAQQPAPVTSTGCTRSIDCSKGAWLGCSEGAWLRLLRRCMARLLRRCMHRHQTAAHSGSWMAHTLLCPHLHTTVWPRSQVGTPSHRWPRPAV